MSISNPIYFTHRALQELQRLQEVFKLTENHFIRIGVKSSSCSGVAYLLAFDTIQDNDTRYEVQGLEVVIDKSHSMHVIGLEIDFEKDEFSNGFVFKNPQLHPTS